LRADDVKCSQDERANCDARHKDDLKQHRRPVTCAVEIDRTPLEFSCVVEIDRLLVPGFKSLRLLQLAAVFGEYN
jgi:hypothetical protein